MNHAIGMRSNSQKNIPIDQIISGDNLGLIKKLPDNSVQLIITSPPYFQQRDYGAGIGNEKFLDDYITNLMHLFKECVRVVKDEGSLVYNVGDKYEDANLLLVPYRFAIAATQTGLVRLVNNITWVKLNPTPRQFQRRLVSSTEPFFHFVKSENYRYNIDGFGASDNTTKKTAIRKSNAGSKYFELIEQSDLSEELRRNARMELAKVIQEVRSGKIESFRMKIRGIHAEAFGGQDGGRKIQMTKNGFTIIRIHGNTIKKDVIEMPVESIKGGKHPAIYPVEIIERFLLLLTDEGDTVLDPYMGSGSTAVACKKLGRHYIGFDINPDYCEYARERVEQTPIQARNLFGSSI